MTTDQLLSALILRQVNAGMTIDAAFDSILGEGAYKKLAGEVYHGLRAKVAA